MSIIRASVIPKAAQILVFTGILDVLRVAVLTNTRPVFGTPICLSQLQNSCCHRQVQNSKYGAGVPSAAAAAGH